MGMFDWYVPERPITCPKCGDALDGWQGKDGPRLLLEWKQGRRSPADQIIDEERAMPPADWEGLVLPEQFEFYTHCDSCFTRVNAVGLCEKQVWTRFWIVKPVGPPGLPEGWAAFDKEDRRRALDRLYRALPSDQVLRNQRMLPLARCEKRDELLVRTPLAEPQLHVVRFADRASGAPAEVQSFHDLSEFGGACEYQER